MFIDVPDESDLDDDAAEWFDRQRNAWGYLPNYVGPFARHVDVARAWSELDRSIKSHMDRRRFELATIAAARAYRSTYCTAAHSKFLRDECGDEQSMRAVAADPTGADLDVTDRAVIKLATQIAVDASSVTAADVQAARDSGLSDDEITSVVFAAAARAFFTKVLDGLGVQADIQLGQKFDAQVREQVTVGRPIASA